MRGKALVQCASSSPPGITPAYAGKSRGQSRNCTNTEDHPRVCGEKAKAFYMKPLEEGSPPRMRGKVPAGLCQIIGFGITPAYAGKSTNSELSSPCTRDHPRVCGEKHTKGQTRPRVAGSPPRMRGKAFMFWPSAVFMGITPAYAGKRLKRSHRIGHFSCILCLFHSVLHRASASGGSRAGPCAPPCLPAQNAVPV